MQRIVFEAEDNATTRAFEYVDIKNIYIAINNYDIHYILIQDMQYKDSWRWIDLDNKCMSQDYEDDDIGDNTFLTCLIDVLKSQFHTIYEFGTMIKVIENWDKIKHIDDNKPDNICVKN